MNQTKKYTYAAIVPLIGGNHLGLMNTFDGQLPEYVLSYAAFKGNDSHYINYLRTTKNWNGDYITLDEQPNYVAEYADIFCCTAPCAGLSSLSRVSHSHSPVNEWMLKSAEYVLEHVKPKVMYGENAPRLATAMGKPVVDKLRAIGEKNGYTFSIFKTKSILHGLSQVRDRAFYFFWKGDSIPIFEYVNNYDTHERIEDTIMNAFVSDDDPMNVLTGKKIPSQDPFYRYALEVIKGGQTHLEFMKDLKQSINILNFIEDAGKTYAEVAVWMKEKGFDTAAARCERIQKKLDDGFGIMKKNLHFPANYIGAFVGHYPSELTHPIEDRSLTVRECLAIMKMPSDFQLINPTSNLNHMCQSVPVTTAEYPARMVQKYLNNELKTVKTKFLIQDNKNQTLSIPGFNVADLTSFI